MKTPTWAITMGILLMVFGGCGLMKHSQAIMMPDVMDMQQAILESAVKDMEDHEVVVEIPAEDDANRWEEDTLGDGETNDTVELESILPPNSKKRHKIAPREMTKAMQEMFAVSDFNRKWIVRFGYIGIVVCAIYLMAGAFLINRKFFSIKFVYGALVLSIFFSLVQMLVISSDMSSGIVSKMSSYGNVFGLVIDIVLLVVFLSINKSDFLKMEEATDSTQEDWEKF